ncbi:MAG: SGNH/GDSL hydrolase family protein [Planctomycetaceae bacterium]|nr:SGNH/GDSL hydrolase family protein [Planctomycetaceae bacterium]
MIARPRRLWLFRLLALSLALLPFLLAEAICWVFGWGEPILQHDPFVGFSSVQPLFELSPDGEHMQIAESRLDFFAMDSFPTSKSPNTRRIFCLGGSTVQGRPYSIQTSFPTWMKLALETAAPQTRWEVVNCGGISYASYRLVPILEEVLQYEPDLIVICTGHNEFLEDRSYAHIKQLPPSAMPVLQWMMKRRLVVIGSTWLRTFHGAPAEVASPELLPTEVDAVLDYRDGLTMYHRDPGWHSEVQQHFEFNLRRMIARCHTADVPLLLLLPPSNLRSQPPFKSETTSGLSPGDREVAQRQHGLAIETAGTDLAESIDLLKQALSRNPDEARWWFQLGQMQFLHGDIPAARRSFVMARDLDTCPLRMTSPLEATLQAVVAETGVPFSNLHTLLEQQTASGILGDDWLVDHVHPGFDGQRLIGVHLVEQLAARGWCDMQDADWKKKSSTRFAEHFADLDSSYLHRGQRALQNLRGWAAGKAEGPSAEERFPHRSRSKVPPVSD